MTMSVSRTRTDRPMVVLWSAGVVWLVAVLVTVLVAHSAVTTVAEAVEVLGLAVIAGASAWMSYRWPGLVTFAVIAAVVSFASESCSIATGFPFGHYTHHIAGPKPLGVPIPVVTGWVVLAWLAWTLARVLTRADPAAPASAHRFTTPLVAALILGGYDFVLDPVAGTVRGLYSYAAPSGQFGVPVSNFLGWLLTGWVICQVFALLERRFAPPEIAPARAHLVLPCLIWLVSAFVPYLARPYAYDSTVVRGDRTFVTADIFDGSLVSGLFAMVPIAVLALVKLSSARR